MQDQSFRILEFEALRTLVSRNAQTDRGRARLTRLTPFTSLSELQTDLKAVGEMIDLRRAGDRLSFDSVADVTESISRLRIAGTALEPLSMLEVAHVSERALEARAVLVAAKEDRPALFDLVAPIPADLKSVSATITRKILPSGELDDRASPQLAAIRRELTAARSRITRALENLMRRSSEAIQEELVTVRNDRFVIPVRADHQARIKGVAHGASSSGATVFVEPLETIEANNELQILREAEQREIAEILFGLSEELRRWLPAIELAAEVITELDFINAKAAFGERFSCVVPQVGHTPVAGEARPSAFRREVSTGSGNGSDRVIAPDTRDSGSQLDPAATAAGTDLASTTFELIDARHPLLEENLRPAGSTVVPVSLKLDHHHPVMIISGANAGGKTVVLKTAGLLSLMALSGLPVPAKQANVPFYRSVLADIGDHQSLAANLSTFTSHVANIAGMIESCLLPALVLLDEVGTGTDPEEGSALGVVVVDHFKQRAAHVLATTHYSGLKIYAANEPGVQNASVEFDEHTLRPTYRLLLGFAGSSSGLEIARRFGIPDSLIKQAAGQIQQSSREAIEYLRRIKLEAETAEHLRAALEEERAAVAEKFGALDREFQKHESARQTEFRNELAQTVTEFEKLSRDLLAKIDDRVTRTRVEREAEKRAAELKRAAQTATQAFTQKARAEGTAHLTKPRGPEVSLPPQLRGVRVVRDGKVVSDAPAEETKKTTKVGPVGPSVDHSADARELRVGDRVRLSSFGTTGVIDRIKGDEAELRVGSLHMREKLSNLELVSGEAGGSPARKEGSLEKMRRRASTEVHLHSKTPASKIRNQSEINLIGKTTDEATDLVDRFLDEAFLDGQTEVRIIHGHGTGALRKAVTEFLSDHPHVARYSAAPADQGGNGATVVELLT